MASYRDLFSSTIQSLGDKIRDVSDRSGVKELYDRGAERAKSYAQAAKLSMAIRSANEELNKTYAALGKLSFEQNANAPDACYAGLFAQAQEILTRRQEKEAELRALREDLETAQAGDVLDAEIVDFEQIVQATEADGCGEQ